jgi:hypothetical protein
VKIVGPRGDAGHEPGPGARPLDHLGAAGVPARGEEWLPAEIPQVRRSVTGVVRGHRDENRVHQELAPLEQWIQRPWQHVVLVRDGDVKIPIPDRWQRLLRFHRLHLEADVRRGVSQLPPGGRDERGGG